jgi:PKD repeat protein
MKTASRLTMVGLLFVAVVASLPDAASASTMASVAAAPNPVEVGQTVQFTASTDPGSSIIEYDWDFGDGNTCLDCGASPTYGYATAGTFTTTVTVYDSNGNSASATVVVHVTPAPRETAQAGSVRAELFYSTAQGQHNALLIEDERVRILLNGPIVSDTATPSLGLQCPACQPIPMGYYGLSPSLQVTDLDARSEPEVLLNVSNGGNICCRYTIVYSYRPASNSYVPTVHDWLDWGDIPPLRDLNHDGQLEWVSGDSRFRYAFACGACSPYPIQIWHFAAASFHDVTRHYPRLVQRDARALYGEYLRERVVRNGYRNVRGILAAYLADEYSLGRAAAGWRTLEAANRGGYLVNYGWPTGGSASAYLRQLRSFLRRLGYIR